MNLGEIPVKQWEDSLSFVLWSKVSDFVFEKIFLTAAQSSQKGELYVSSIQTKIFKIFLIVRTLFCNNFVLILSSIL